MSTPGSVYVYYYYYQQQKQQEEEYSKIFVSVGVIEEEETRSPLSRMLLLLGIKELCTV